MQILHVMLRVGNLDDSVKFYCDVLGMKVLHQKDYPEGKFTLVFVGYGDDADDGSIQLTYNWDTDKYDLGNGYGHVAIGVENVYAICEEIRLRGGKITREPGSIKDDSKVIAFAEDPDGYKIELIQRL
ncbi:MAG: lactoylglutathione lyase [Symploca sp. SIO2G7]|nr:lactoylglutathione lyase [Symploca sp. SIO2G7]